MKNKISHLALLIALSAGYTTEALAATEASTPKTRTWGEYAKQKAAATFTVDQTARAAAQAKFEADSLKVQAARLAAATQKEEAKKAQEAAYLAEYQRAQKERIEHERALQANQSAYETTRKARLSARTEALGVVTANTASTSAAGAPNAGFIGRMGLSRKSSASVPVTGNVQVGVDQAATKIGPNFAAYLTDKSRRAGAIAEIAANATAKGAIPPEPAAVGALKNAFLNGKSRGATVVDVPAAYVR